jgi:glucosamine--fructose-6-phosphate aminotransferase (isomerizing)
MCGIVGYVGHRPVRDVLLGGLQKLEYRGYDSAGISVIAGDAVESVRAVGNLGELVAAVAATAGEGDGAVAVATMPATTGIGHTRWATHGRVSEQNAHPLTDTEGRVHVVVNGIVENYLALRERLADMGAVFSTETDAEVIAHLVSHHLALGGLVEAVRAAYAELRGHFAFVALNVDEPDVLVGARKECPLVVGRGDSEQFLGSAIPAFLAHTRRMQIIENDEIVVVRPDGVDFGHELDEGLLRGAKRVVILACGTSYHAGLVGKYAIEEWARLPVETDVASEYRYRNAVLGPDDLVIGITQSGETADTLAAMRKARDAGATVIAVTNVMGSQATRDADGVLYTRAGLEIGVAATKTFVCQVALMYLLALRLAELRGTLPAERRRELVADLKRMPELIDQVVDSVGEQVARAADQHFEDVFFLYLGRHLGLPVALEGALKLKEISYVATDAYAAGEMKHGPIALLDERTPVVVVATDSPVLEKVASNMQEVRVRGAHVIAVGTEGNVDIGEHAEEVLRVPRTDWTLQPLLAVVPLQLLAYAIARRRGLNVDQPRNLAKTVTVE